MNWTEIQRFYKNKRVLVTGHTGFKGSWLAYWLHLMGAKVYGIALPPKYKPNNFELLGLHKKIKSKFIDIRTRDKFRPAALDSQADIIIHLAAQSLVIESYKNPVNTFETNVLGGVNLLETVRELKPKAMVFITSDKCYENKEWHWGYRENDALGGEDPYSASKAAMEIIFHSYNQSFLKKEGISVATARAGNVIGGGDWSENRIVPDLVRNIFDGKKSPVIIRNPSATRPWQHVLEPLRGYLILAMKLYTEGEKHTGAWNFGPNIFNNVSVETLTRGCSGVWDKIKISYPETRQNNLYESTLLYLNIDKAISRLNWYPVLTFDETIRLTMEWYKHFYENREAETIANRQIDFIVKKHDTVIH